MVSVPSPKYGEEVVAYIVKKANATIDEEEVKTFVYNHMARYKVPSFVRFIDSMPMTASGKIQKFVLREMAKNDERINAILNS